MIVSRFLTAVSVLLLATATTAAPNTIKPVELEVYTPHITAPTGGAVWNTDEVQTVTWDISKLDDAGKNTAGFLLLGYTLANDTSGNEHLDIKHPLATGFKLGDAAVNVTVPNVETRDSYIVVLIGDSGNASPAFTIVGTPTGTEPEAAAVETAA